MPFVMLEVIAWPEARAAASTSGIPAVTVVFRDDVACVASPWIAASSSPDPAVTPFAMVSVMELAARRDAASICGTPAIRPSPMAFALSVPRPRAAVLMVPSALSSEFA